MAVTLTQMATNIATLTIPVGDATANIQYYPGKVTNRIMNMFDGSLEERDQAVIEVVKSWDCYEDAEQTQMIPLTVERLADIQMDFKFDIIRAIARDVRPEARAPRIPTN